MSMYSQKKLSQSHKKLPYPHSPFGLYQEIHVKTFAIQGKTGKTEHFVPQMFCTKQYTHMHVSMKFKHSNHQFQNFHG